MTDICIHNLCLTEERTSYSANYAFNTQSLFYSFTLFFCINHNEKQSLKPLPVLDNITNPSLLTCDPTFFLLQSVVKRGGIVFVFQL